MAKEQSNKKENSEPNSGAKEDINRQEKILSIEKYIEDNCCVDDNSNEGLEAKLPAPFMTNPSEIDKNKNTSAKSMDSDDKATECPTRINDLYKVPFIQEFDILKDSKGDFKIDDIHQKQIQLQVMSDVNIKPNAQNENALIKKKISSNTPKKSHLSNQPKEQSLANKLFRKQHTQSIVLEAALNTQTPSSIHSPAPQEPNNEKKVVDKREIKLRKNFITLARSKNLLGLLVLNSNNKIKIFSEQEGFHQKSFCCEMLYNDDCCLKWVFDLLFQIIFLPCRFLIFLARVCLACFQGFDDEDEVPPQDNRCFQECYKCHYCPFKCLGDWINQCSYSFQLYICKGLWFLPEQAITLYNTTSLKCLIQVGLFFKSCCYYSSNQKWVENLTDMCCMKPFHLLGECLQWFCSPQGFCETFFFVLKKVTCNIFNQNCIQKVFCCCSSTVKKTLKNNKELAVTYCCGCAIDTTGEAVNAEQNL